MIPSWWMKLCGVSVFTQLLYLTVLYLYICMTNISLKYPHSMLKFSGFIVLFTPLHLFEGFSYFSEQKTCWLYNLKQPDSNLLHFTTLVKCHWHLNASVMKPANTAALYFWYFKYIVLIILLPKNIFKTGLKDTGLCNFFNCTSAAFTSKCPKTI